MRWEVEIQRRKSDNTYDWEGMGMKPPKGEVYYRRCLIDTLDIELIEELNKEFSLLKCTWMESAVVVKGGYNDLTLALHVIEDEVEEQESEQQ
jgi:hypothetical protein